MRPVTTLTHVMLLNLSLQTQASNSCHDVLQAKLEKIQSFNHETIDHEASVYVPKNLDELQRLVRLAARDRKRIRVVGASHSVSSIILSDGVYVRTSHLNKI